MTVISSAILLKYDINPMSVYWPAVDQFAYFTNVAQHEDKLFAVFQGESLNSYAVKFDGKAWSKAVKVGDSPFPPILQDGHGAPSIVRSVDGILHVIYGMHDGQSAVNYKVSAYPDDISSWVNVRERFTSSGNLLNGTYPALFLDPKTGMLWLFIRDYTPPNDNARWLYLTSGNNGVTWGNEFVWYDALSTAQILYLAQMGQFVNKEGDDYYINLSGNMYSASVGKRVNYYFLRFNMSNKHFYNISGTDLGLTMSNASFEYAKVLDTNYKGCYWGQVLLSTAGTLSVINYEYDSSSGLYKFFSKEWNGSAWTNSVDICTSSRWQAIQGAVFQAGTNTIALLEPKDEDKKITQWKYDWSAHTWSQLGDYIDSTSLDNQSDTWRGPILASTETPIWCFQSVAPSRVQRLQVNVGAVDVNGNVVTVTEGTNLSADRGINVNQQWANVIVGRDRQNYYALDCESGKTLRIGTYNEVTSSAVISLPRGYGIIIDKSGPINSSPSIRRYADGNLVSAS